MKILVFGGTSEGRELAQWLIGQSIPTTVCVATGYGGTLLPQGVEQSVGRLNQAEMEELMGQGYTLAIDATHPYAAIVTQTVQAAAQSVGLPLLRLIRERGTALGDWCSVPDMAAAAQLLTQMEGKILLTTGSKELNHFAQPGLVERCFPRVLPVVDSLERCRSLGYLPAHIICMQGPFGVELNQAIIRQFGIDILVTKATGGAGGFWDKIKASQITGCQLIVVEPPLEEEGMTLTELQAYLSYLS